MGILDTLLSSQNAQLVAQLAKNSGIDSTDVQNVMGQLLPALSQGVKTNVNQSGGIDQLIGALSKGNHQHYIDDPQALADASAVNEGNAILGHVLGSKEASRNIAAQTAQSTGVSNDIVKQLLPLVATAMMGALSKETSNSAIGGVGNLDLSGLLGGNASPIVGMVTSFLDANNDGDVTDDLLNLAKKFF